MSNDWIPALIVLVVVYMVGGIHGLWLAWTQEAKCRRWAYRVSELYEATHPIEKEPTP